MEKNYTVKEVLEIKNGLYNKCEEAMNCESKDSDWLAKLLIDTMKDYEFITVVEQLNEEDPDDINIFYLQSTDGKADFEKPFIICLNPAEKNDLPFGFACYDGFDNMIQDENIIRFLGNDMKDKVLKRLLELGRAEEEAKAKAQNVEAKDSKEN